MTLDQCRVRIKEWLYEGILIEDGVVNAEGEGAVVQHMKINAQRFRDEDIGEDLLDALHA